MSLTTLDPSGYVASIIFLKGLVGSTFVSILPYKIERCLPGATLEIMMNIAPVARVGNIAGNTSGLKKRNSSQTIN